MKRNVMITGANRGIGRALVQKFSENGDNIWACARTQSAEFENELAGLARQRNIWIEPIYFDVSDDAAVKEAVSRIRKKKGSIDILINNAGIGHMALLQMTSMEKIREIFDVNLLAVIQLCQVVSRLMMRQGKGQIINVASTAAYEINAGNSIYGASKAAVVAFSKSLAAELAPYGITVNAIGPSLVNTKMSAIFEGNDPELAVSRTALGRKIEVDEIANIVVELTKDQMRLINGQVIYINGGQK